jgi:hypothetical protein
MPQKEWMDSTTDLFSRDRGRRERTAAFAARD